MVNIIRGWFHIHITWRGRAWCYRNDQTLSKFQAWISAYRCSTCMDFWSQRHRILDPGKDGGIARETFTSYMQIHVLWVYLAQFPRNLPGQIDNRHQMTDRYLTAVHKVSYMCVITAIVPDSAGCWSMLVDGWCSWRPCLAAEQISHTGIQDIDAVCLMWSVEVCTGMRNEPVPTCPHSIHRRTKELPFLE